MAEPTLLQLISSGRIVIGTRLYHPTRSRGEFASEGEIVANGLRVGDTVYRTPSAAAVAVTGAATNGWLFWRVRPSDKPLALLRRSARE
jgi:Restriction Enzyme Adenine Methylase Associated